MSRRPGSGHHHHHHHHHHQQHIPQNVPADIPRDDRQPPPPHLARYIDQPPRPTTPHARSDVPHYTSYHVPASRLSYAPDARHPAAEPRHSMHSQRHMELARSHERGAAYPRPPGEYYPPEAPMPPVHQPAPRQRTAVACRYCRRRKIRCSGYQSSPDGRCTNCVQRDQKCEFLPVSAVSASPYDAPRPETSYLSPQATPQVPIGGHRPSRQYSLPPPPPPPPTYHLSPYGSPHQQRKRPAESDLPSPPRKRTAMEPSSVGRPVLAPIETSGSLRRRPTMPDTRPEYVELPMSTPHSQFGQRSPPYTASGSPRRRQGSHYSSASSLQPSSSSIPSARSTDVSAYTLLPPPQRPRSPVRTTPVTRRYSYHPHTPYSPEHVYPPRPSSQGGTHIPSPMSATTLPPPLLTYPRTSPTMQYASAPGRPVSEYPDRPTRSPGYEYGEPTAALPPLAHLNRDTPPIQALAPAMPSPIPVSLPPPTGMIITAPRNPRDTAILSAFDTVSDSPSSRAQLKRTPSPESGQK